MTERSGTSSLRSVDEKRIVVDSTDALVPACLSRRRAGPGVRSGCDPAIPARIGLALRQPLTANSSLSRITLSGWSRGGSGSRSGVIKWRNSLISVRQSSSVRSSGHSAASGSQQVIGGILPSSFPLLWRFDPKAYPDAPNGGSRASQQSRIGETSRFAIAGACCVGSESLRRCPHAVALGACGA